MDARFDARIASLGNIDTFLTKVSQGYGLDVLSTHLITLGYEDYNVILGIAGGKKILLKIFADMRSDEDCHRYLAIMRAVLDAGVHHPALLTGQSDLFKNRLCLMDFIDGKTLYQSQYILTDSDIIFLAQESSNINTMSLKPGFLYDSWAIINFIPEYKKNSPYLTFGMKEYLNELQAKFSQITIDSLPDCFVHGDLIPTNIIRDTTGGLRILDFSVSNYYPRIVEIAVVAVHLLIVKDDPLASQRRIKLFLQEYQNKAGKLSSYELDILPLFMQVGFAMDLLGATYEKEVNGNESAENAYFLERGKWGLDTRGLGYYDTTTS